MLNYTPHVSGLELDPRIRELRRLDIDRDDLQASPQLVVEDRGKQKLADAGRVVLHAVEAFDDPTVPEVQKTGLEETIGYILDGTSIKKYKTAVKEMAATEEDKKDKERIKSTFRVLQGILDRRNSGDSIPLVGDLHVVPESPLKEEKTRRIGMNKASRIIKQIFEEKGPLDSRLDELCESTQNVELLTNMSTPQGQTEFSLFILESLHLLYGNSLGNAMAKQKNSGAKTVMSLSINSLDPSSIPRPREAQVLLPMFESLRKTLGRSKLVDMIHANALFDILHMAGPSTSIMNRIKSDYTEIAKTSVLFDYILKQIDERSGEFMQDRRAHPICID